LRQKACSEGCAAHSAVAHIEPDSSQMKRKDRKEERKCVKRAAKSKRKSRIVKCNLSAALELARVRGLPE
jgi:hypothetical protein